MDALNNILFNSDLDLSQSDIIRDDASQFRVRARITPIRICFSLLFGIPFLYLLAFAIRQQGFFIILPVVFCPPLAFLSVIFGLAVQEKILTASGRGVKAFRILTIQRECTVTLPENGVVAMYKTWSQGEGKGCYFYHADIKDVEGFGFCIARDEEKMNAFAHDLADFLKFSIAAEGEKPKDIRK